MHCLLSKTLFDGKGGVIFDSQLHKEGFMIFMDPDFGIPLCFCLSLGIKLTFLLSILSHLYILFIPLLIFWFAFTQHRLVSFPKSGSYPVKSLKFSTFNMDSMNSKKTEFFLLICVVKVQRY